MATSSRTRGPRGRSHRATAAVLLTLIILLDLWPGPESGAAGDAPGGKLRISADSAVLIDWNTGRILYAKAANQPRPMASTTKIMTGLLVLEKGNLSDVVTVSRRAASTPGSSMNIRGGEKLTLERLLYGVLMRSGNDASVAVAEHIAGTEAAFVAMMNARARTLGAYHTQFRNPHGLTAPGHYSTAYDLALMARAALTNPNFANIVATREKLFVTAEEQRQVTLRNTNRLLWSFEGADGVKTGTTSAAGKCLVASATRGDEKLIAVVLHSSDRYGDAAKLLTYGFDHYRVVQLAAAGEVVKTIRVRGGLAPRAAVIAVGQYAAALSEEEMARSRVEWDLPATLSAPLDAGEPVGEVRVYVDGEIRETYPLVTRDENPRRTLWRVFLNGFLPVLRWLAGIGIG